MGLLSLLGRVIREWLDPALKKQRLAGHGISKRLESLKQFWFLADAPEFIDASLVGRLYETIFQPEYEVASRTTGTVDAKASELSAEIGTAAEVSIPTVFKLSASGKGASKDTASETQSAQILETAIVSPERRLERLLNVYAYSYPDRLFWILGDLVSAVDLNGKSLEWHDLEAVLDKPGLRPIVVLDIKPGTKLIPMFAELTDGKDVPLYDNLITGLNAQDKVPVYPTFGTQDYDAKSRQYWSALASVFKSAAAMTVVETSTKDGRGRLAWIDFRTIGTKRNGQPEAIHLHCCPRGDFPSGTFGYQFIRRAEKYGLRLVGTLKKGSDINVLAFYQR